MDLDYLQKERNWVIEQFQNFAKARRVRVTFLSGDVHCAAVGVLKTLKLKNKQEIPAASDHRYMLNIVTSTCSLLLNWRLIYYFWFKGAIVNTPPWVFSVCLSIQFELIGGLRVVQTL